MVMPQGKGLSGAQATEPASDALSLTYLALHLNDLVAKPLY